MSKKPVGYGKPPKKNQFKKGESGNPKGRPKKEKPQQGTDILTILKEDVEVILKGRKQTVCLAEAGYRVMISTIIKEGHRSSLKKLLKDMEKYGLLKPPPDQFTGGVLHMPKRWDREKWLAKLKEQGVPPCSGPDDGLTDCDRERFGIQAKSSHAKNKRSVT